MNYLMFIATNELIFSKDSLRIITHFETGKSE